ncbi:uncharacterized protein L969DRAFT_86839 [Mixia osmundae IAM 14324]|uniref:FHA domain-containing protein n=1 Tax=Mixia osmundae (strain CBS 9802 / IAM 14324 / JCM 22182 / KY 12970) TaxID=764103 RepID=G7E8W1_MIXOS|nr:uncharacterized protein L969DRAFT_86839 [Mixia osmundae IAM 14324]KEI40214.1 hypothetical protein L969DRAFT_86839 [Mixia osmundae IAM 14324]GAA99579.1 hypothetical protein E5Q_06280 [Mixia osmundae IAM 14324]
MSDRRRPRSRSRSPRQRSRDEHDDSDRRHREERRRDYARDDRPRHAPRRAPSPSRDERRDRLRRGELLPQQAELVPVHTRAGPSQSAPEVWGKADEAQEEVQPPRGPPKPNFANSGRLAAETNTYKGVVLKYNEPPEARKPSKKWRLYVFKGAEQVDMFVLDRQSAYLIGRDRIVVDIPIEHPSSSKQHAVFQFRQITERNEFGDVKQPTKLFLIDLESANGTSVNGETIPQAVYYEIKTGDVVKFADSTREYVVLVEP